MKTPLQKSAIHAVEVGAVALVVVVAMYLFRDPLNELLLGVVRDAETRTLFMGLIGVLITGVASGIPKWLRTSDEVPLKDYVNE